MSHSKHRWKPIHDGVTPLYIDMETGDVMRLKAVTKPEDLKVRERCTHCKLSRTRTWKMVPNPSFPDELEVVETTAPDSVCLAAPLPTAKA